MTGVIVNYYRKLDHKRVQFDFLYFDDNGQNYKKEIAQLGGKVYRISKPAISRKSHKEINEFFERHYGEFTAIHCHPVWAPAVFAPIARKNGIQHVIAHSHLNKCSENLFSAFRNYLMIRLAKPFVTEYMACSEEAKGVFPFVSKKNVTILNNAIDTDRFCYSEQSRKEVRKALGISDDTVLVGHVGRLVPMKNHEFLLRIFSEYRKIQVNSKLLLLGDGPLLQSINSKIKELELDESVILLKSRSDVQRFYSAMDIFVLPSLYEGLGVVLLEAQASGLNCIASDVVPDEAAVSGRLVYISLKSTPREWAVMIENILERDSSNRSENNVRKEFIKKKYDISIAAEFLMDYYEKLK